MTVDKVVKSVNNESMKEEVISRLKVNESDGNVGVVTNWGMGKLTLKGTLEVNHHMLFGA